MPLNNKAVFLAAGAGLFLYSGLSGFSVLKTIQNVIQGQPANAGQTDAVLSASIPGGPTGSGLNDPIGGSISSKTPAACRAWMKAHMSDYGWGPEQWGPLDNLWDGESGWRWDAQNPDSPAYGIPQANPGEKMASAGADWKTNPVTQMRWGADYIKNNPNYGTPARTYALWLSRNPHWY
jgi:hypothetical protein